MSEQKLIGPINESVNLDGARIGKINKDFNELRDTLSTQKIKEIFIE